MFAVVYRKCKHRSDGVSTWMVVPRCVIWLYPEVSSNCNVLWFAIVYTESNFF